MQIKKPHLGNKVWLVLVVLLVAVFFAWKHFSKPASLPIDNVATQSASSTQGEANAALTVRTVKLAMTKMDDTIEANGNIQPWQEAIIGAEVSGLLLKEVLVNVGDEVKKGQTIARFSNATIEAEIAQSTAALAEAKANYIEANGNAERARGIKDMGALSRQQIDQFLSAEAVAKARVESAEANLDVQKIKLNQTAVIAPDSGIISSRTATVGAVANQGQELFRLIRQSRLEWRAEITSTDIAQIKPDQAVAITLPDGKIINGKVRTVSPTINQQTRNGLVYVDLPLATAKAGMYARGSFHLGESQAFTLPANAIVLREGFAYVMQVGANSRIKQIKVHLGRRNADRVEVAGLKDELQGLDANFVAAGGAFLANGDLVRVVTNASIEKAE